MTTQMLDTIEELTRRVPALRLIGNTPLLQLPLPQGGLCLAKAEWTNPGLSIKDRPILWMLARAMQEGQLSGTRRVLDITSGNSGIAYAMIGSALGIGITLVVPGYASKERIYRMQAHGAEVILTPPEAVYDDAMRLGYELARNYPEKYVMLDQYANQANIDAHYNGTGEEILRQWEGEISHFVSGVGTGGTLTGVGGRLKDAFPTMRMVHMMPAEDTGIQGLKPLKAPGAIVPKNFRREMVDETLEVTVEEAYGACHWLARNGVFVGQSSGANFAAARKLAMREAGARVATVFPDTGERYYSAGLWK
ncbi:MAG: cysteine synthase family protein [Planctomycetes bacterium]|nr:cysteine synthase family protein [Planctomycetota bacterium]